MRVSFLFPLYKFDRLDSVRSEEPFLLLADIKCMSPWPVEIETSSLTLVSTIKPTCLHIKITLEVDRNLYKKKKLKLNIEKEAIDPYDGFYYFPTSLH